MTENEFHLALWEAIAEDDKDVCECCKCGASDLTTEGIDHLVKMAVCVAEPLFAEVQRLRQKLNKIAHIEANRFPDTSTWKDLASEAINIARAE